MTPLCLCALLGLTALHAAAGPRLVRLLPGVPLVIPPGATNAVKRAAADLQRDLATVMGVKSPLLVERPTEALFIEIQAPDPSLGGPEAHGIRVVCPLGEPARILLSGSDVRGLIYALYSFSEHVLDVPPLWYFADWKPVRQTVIELPSDFAMTFPAPHVRWRGWFPNDKDMYDAWEQDASEEKHDRVLETMLRLKLNVLDLEEITDYPSRELLRRPRHTHDRGLVLTTTHTSPLGTNWSYWESYWREVRHQEPPPLRLDQTLAMEEFWSHHIDLCRREGFEMIWELGFRGFGDHGFANAFPDAPRDAAGRAMVIGDMIRRQLALVRSHQGAGQLRMRTVLYNECSDYHAAGLLELPVDPDLMWNFVGARRDHFPAADIRRGDLPPTQPYAYYLNLQFTSTGAHLAQAEGPWKIARNLQLVAAASPRPLDLWVVNVGNFREFLIEMSAHASLAWAPSGWEADTFLVHWCTQYFGEQKARDAAAVLRAYYDSFWEQRAPDLPQLPRQYLFQDMRVARACEDLLDHWTRPLRAIPLDDRSMGYYRIDPSIEKTADQLSAVTRGLGRSIEKLQEVTRAAAKLEPGIDACGRRLWHDHVRVPAQVLLATDRALLCLIRGYRERGDQDLRTASLQDAENAFAEARQWLSSADEAPFTGWSEPENLWGINVMREKIALLLAGKKVLRRERP